ncbi:MAG: hypothetical protein KDI62_16720 [Anaerolineae bacterium]|nr:hypothetical protein [Anaerolineae bacterium]MCB0179877.1 hypothetical protein [Anaerolineae bacterium]MCB9108803.1 hypothetical protein [Anaerolineales bacterium]
MAATYIISDIHGQLDSTRALLRQAGLITADDIWAGQRLVHGHTPISKITDQPPKTVDEPLLYAGGRCVNVDGGMYLGGPGCLYRLPND